MPGFEVEAGANFEAHIDPFSCSGNTYSRKKDSVEVNDKHNPARDTGYNDSTLLYGMSILPFKKNNYVPLEQNENQPMVKTDFFADSVKKTIAKKQVHVQFSIIPNPSANGMFSVSGINISNYSSVKVYNVLGETIFQSANYPINSSPNYSIDISTQPRGIYFVKIDNGGEISVQKIVYQ